jgi:hypothetical protein
MPVFADDAIPNARKMRDGSDQRLSGAALRPLPKERGSNAKRAWLEGEDQRGWRMVER